MCRVACPEGKGFLENNEGRISLSVADFITIDGGPPMIVGKDFSRNGATFLASMVVTEDTCTSHLATANQRAKVREALTAQWRPSGEESCGGPCTTRLFASKRLEAS